MEYVRSVFVHSGQVLEYIFLPFDCEAGFSKQFFIGNSEGDIFSKSFSKNAEQR